MSPPSSPPSPAYTATPQAHEYHLAFDPRLRPNRPPRLFVKQTKNGNLSLRLADQDDRTPLPVYGLGASVQGTVEISKTEGITSVEVQVEGNLKLEEIAEGGTSTHRLFLSRNIIWIKDRTRDSPCPRSLRFNFRLPTTYSDRDETYLLPPSYEAHLTGLPGFRAHVTYSVTAMVVKPNDVSSMVKSTILFRKDDWTVSTPFLYLPRSRPSASIPVSLVAASVNCGFTESPHWKLFSSIVTANQQDVRDVVAKFYIPATRIFSVRQPIPFHLSFQSDTESLHAFAQVAPVAGLVAPKRQITRIQLMRQTSVDVCNAMMFGTKADIWRVDCIGEGAFRNAGTGAGWVAFSGDIFICNEITVGGFRASGFSIRDYLVLAMTPPDLFKSPFKELRMVVPIRLVTDRWSDDAAGSGTYGSPSLSPSEERVAVPKTPYAFGDAPTSPTK